MYTYKYIFIYICIYIHIYIYIWFCMVFITGACCQWIHFQFNRLETTVAWRHHLQVLWSSSIVFTFIFFVFMSLLLIGSLPTGYSVRNVSYFSFTQQVLLDYCLCEKNTHTHTQELQHNVYCLTLRQREREGEREGALWTVFQ